VSDARRRSAACDAASALAELPQNDHVHNRRCHIAWTLPFLNKVLRKASEDMRSSEKACCSSEAEYADGLRTSGERSGERSDECDAFDAFDGARQNALAGEATELIDP
jgi:transposase